MRRLTFLLFIIVILLSACGGKEDQPPTPSPTKTIAPTFTPTISPTSSTNPDELPIEGEIIPGENYAGKIATDSLTLRWTLAGEAEHQLLIQLTQTAGNGSLTLDFLDPNGDKVLSLGTGSGAFLVTDSITLEMNGEYLVMLSSDSNDVGYLLNIVDTTPVVTPTTEATLTPSPSPTSSIPTLAPTLTPIPPGARMRVNETIFATLSQSGSDNRYTFIGTAGDTLAIVVNPDPATLGEFDPYMELQAPDGEIVAENDNWRDGILDAYISYEFEVTGVYTIYVRSADNQSVGSYYLSLSNGFTLRDVEQGVATLDTPITQRLATYGARDVWTTDLQKGDMITIDAEAVDPDTFNIMLELVSPTGESWFDDDSGESTNALLTNITVPVSGTYRIHIAGRNNAYIGDYRLQLSKP